ncbi:MAG TPA: hypothetical protein PK683_10675 [Leptospiraceae bacterium]|nr:hypothetical protein [Leptospiraceae bacterium]
MSSSKENYTEFESECLKLSALFGSTSIILADNMFTNFKSFTKEFGAMESIFNGIVKKYPSNSLVQEYFTLDPEKIDMTNVMQIPDQIYSVFEGKGISNSELKAYLEIPSIRKLKEEGAAAGLFKRLSYACMIVAVIAKKILEDKSHEERGEFFQAIYDCAEEIAKTAKEGWFGLGDAVSKNEAAILAKLKENLL